MPFLATTRAGVSNYLEHMGQLGHLWLGCGILSPAETKLLWKQGRNLTVFEHVVQSQDEIEEAAITMREHHPGESVWLEQRGPNINSRSSDVGQAFLWNEYIVGVQFEHNAFVVVSDGPFAGHRGNVIALLDVDPEPLFLVELEIGRDVEVAQSAVYRADV